MSTNDAATDDAQHETTSGDEDELPSSLERDDFEEGDRILVNYASVHSDERQQVTGLVTGANGLRLTVDGDEEYDDGTPKIYYVDSSKVKLETRNGQERRITPAIYSAGDDPTVILQRDDEPVRRRFIEEFDAYESGKVFDDSEGHSCLMSDEDHVAMMDADDVEHFGVVDLSTAVTVESGLRPGRLTSRARHGPAYTHALEVDDVRGAFSSKYVESIEDITEREIGDFEISVWVSDRGSIGPVLLELEDTDTVFLIAPRTAKPENIVFDDEDE